jgi:glycosyl transferase family WbsX
VFIKSWNEWAEGNYLEPDQKFGHEYLNALKSAVRDFKPKLPSIVTESGIV